MNKTSGSKRTTQPCASTGESPAVALQVAGLPLTVPTGHWNPAWLWLRGVQARHLQGRSRSSSCGCISLLLCLDRVLTLPKDSLLMGVAANFVVLGDTLRKIAPDVRNGYPGSPGRGGCGL